MTAISYTLMRDGIATLAAGIARDFAGEPRVAGYADGPYAWSQAEWDLFPGVNHVKIAVRASFNGGDVLDVEKGDATLHEAPGWIDMRHAAGLYRPTVYCSLSAVPAVRAATGHRILGRDYDIWVAEYTTRATPPAVPGLPPAGYAAWQRKSTGAWDESLVLDQGWPHRSPGHPAPIPIPVPAGPSGTATAANVAWGAVPGAVAYRLQHRDGAGVVIQSMVGGTHASVALSGPGPHSWRVQAAGGAWTAWLAIG